MCGSLKRKAHGGRKANPASSSELWVWVGRIFDSVRRKLVRTPADGINRSILQSRL